MFNIFDILQDGRKLNSLAASLTFWIGLLLLGLMLASFTWSLLLPPQIDSTHRELRLSTAQPKDKHFPMLDIVKSLHQLNPWENIPAVRSEQSETHATPVPSTLDLILIGTLVLPEQEKSMAVLLRKENEQKQLFLSIGDKVDDAVLTKIERNSVILRRNGKFEIVSMDPAAKMIAMKTTGVAGGGGSRRATDLRIERERFESIVSQGTKLLKGVSISPYYSGSKSVGYQLNFLGRNNSFEEFGVQSGDVVERVNGTPVVNAPEMSKLLRGIHQSGIITIDLQRDGSPLTVKVGIDG